MGSSHVAQLISRRCRALDKRVLALGGAKNHLVALEDADIEMASKDIVASFAGCAGQRSCIYIPFLSFFIYITCASMLIRCMAASVLLLVGTCDELLKAIVSKAKALNRGTNGGQVGAIIDKASKER